MRRATTSRWCVSRGVIFGGQLVQFDQIGSGPVPMKLVTLQEPVLVEEWMERDLQLQTPFFGTSSSGDDKYVDRCGTDSFIIIQQKHVRLIHARSAQPLTKRGAGGNRPPRAWPGSAAAYELALLPPTQASHPLPGSEHNGPWVFALIIRGRRLCASGITASAVIHHEPRTPILWLSSHNIFYRLTPRFAGCLLRIFPTSADSPATGECLGNGYTGVDCPYGPAPRG